MDSSSLLQYIGQNVRLTLKNGFWYKAHIISVDDEAVVFTELKGRKISVSPSLITMIEEVQNGS